MHLKFDLMYGATDGEIRPGHPQKVMRELGIKFQYMTPQTIFDEWWFWNCQNIPNPLPPFLSILSVDPMDMIGRGLSKEVAIEIRDFIETAPL